MKDGKISAQQLNFIIAVCAIFISAASFYATYLQADAANKQVKAMTLPLLQFSHGNWDEKSEQNKLTFAIKNAAVGAAIIKNVSFIYQNSRFDSFDELFLDACCEPEYGQFMKKAKQVVEDSSNTLEKIGFPMTRPIENTVLVGGGENEFFQMVLTEKNKNFWIKLNQARRQLKAEICYCSLLDDCYVSKENGVAKAVEQCL